MYQFGNSSASLSFTVYSATKAWSGDSLSYDSLKFPSTYYDQSGNPILIQSSEDTGWTTILIRDTAIVRAWFIIRYTTSK